MKQTNTGCWGEHRDFLCHSKWYIYAYLLRYLRVLSNSALVPVFTRLSDLPTRHSVVRYWAKTARDGLGRVLEWTDNTRL